MGFRFRKSFTIIPGVRVNLGKRGVGVSAGMKGARISVNSSGRVTKSVSIPGTGLSYSDTGKIGDLKDHQEQQETHESPKPQTKRKRSWRTILYIILGILEIILGLFVFENPATRIIAVLVGILLLYSAKKR